VIARARAIVLVVAMTVNVARADELTPETASRLAQLPLACLRREFPNKLEHVLNVASDAQRPRALHPAFYGCLDWHSAVHGHWMLAKLLAQFPAMPEADAIRATLDETLTAVNIAVELAYLDAPNRQSFERTYGWAWLLALSAELHAATDAHAKKWAAAVAPLADAIAKRLVAFLPKQTYPIRTGVHANTAFALGLALDYARAVGDRTLEIAIVERATAYFERDVDYPAAWEPGGEDLLSPALVEADLMRRVLAPAKLAPWLHRFLPKLAKGEPRALLAPAIVTDRSDPKLAHLDGLNLSRAWCMRAIASALPARDPARTVFAAAARVHATDGLAHVATADYAGEHWLATYAVYLLATKAP
jgi:hypothetical protein